MNKENILTFRLPGDLYRDLSQRAAKEGCTMSDLARKIIMEHARVEEMSRVLEEIAKKHSVEHVQIHDLIKRLAGSLGTNKGVRNLDEDIRKIIILVTCIVDTLPGASARRREYGLDKLQF